MKCVTVMAFVLAAFYVCTAQTTTVFISDNQGNVTNGTITNGNLLLYDSSGNSVFGTIKNGNVFLSTNKGEITLGTVKNGNVFLTDNTGITTGTIRNGNIFLSNGDGSLTFGTYDHAGNVHTTTTPAYVPPSPQQPVTVQTNTAAQDEARRNYAAGYAVGQAIGNGILRHRIRGYCKKHPGQDVYLNHRFIGTCPD